MTLASSCRSPFWGSLTDFCSLSCLFSFFFTYFFFYTFVSWSVRLWCSSFLSCLRLCLKSNSALHKVLLLLDLCGFWSFSEHLQMANFTHYLGGNRHLLFSSDQHHFCYLEIAPQLSKGNQPSLLHVFLACDSGWPKSS